MEVHMTMDEYRDLMREKNKGYDLIKELMEGVNDYIREKNGKNLELLKEILIHYQTQVLMYNRYINWYTAEYEYEQKIKKQEEIK